MKEQRWSLYLAVAALLAFGEARADEIHLKVEPLAALSSDRIAINFSYWSPRAYGVGQSDFTLIDVDTGKRYSQKVPIEIKGGNQSGYSVAWGGKAPFLKPVPKGFENKIAQETEKIPPGFYAPEVVIRSADGKVLASQTLSPSELSVLKAERSGGRVFDMDEVDAATKTLEGWRDRLEAARASSPNTSASRRTRRALSRPLSSPCRRSACTSGTASSRRPTESRSFCWASACGTCGPTGMSSATCT